MERRIQSYKDLGKTLPPGGQHQGASGAIAGSDSIRTGGDRGRTRQTTVGQPEQANAEITQNSQSLSASTVTTRSASGRDNTLLPETTLAGKTRARMKWTPEVNTFIMRSYYYLTRLENDLTTYRQKLHQAFVAEYPEVQVTEQRIADQRRAIVTKKYLSEETLNNIKRMVRERLDRETDQDHYEDEPAMMQLQMQTTEEERERTPTGEQNEEETTNLRVLEIEQQEENSQGQQAMEEMKDLLGTMLQNYSGINPTHRPVIPKQKTSRKLAGFINTLNGNILPELVRDTETFSDLHDLIYCSAITIATLNGAKIRDNNDRETQPKERVPPWKQRIMRKIATKRAEIARLLEYNRGNPSNRLKRKVKEYFEKYRIHTPRDLPNTIPTDFLDTLQQRLAALSTRLKRYSQCNKRKRENYEFRNNEKKFYRSLKMQVRPREETEATPDEEGITTYWSSLWSQSEQYNENAEWLKREEEDNIDMREMEEPEVTEELVSEVIRGTHSWKSPGSDHLHNFWYKKLTSTHKKLAEYIEDFLKHPEKVPSFITEGKTYLLPKGKQSRDPSKYRPITCLQTVYKIITSCLAKVLNKHIEDLGIMSEEQKGCRKGTKGCKEQLIIDSTILREVKKKQRKLACCYVDYQKAYDSVPHAWLIRVLQVYKTHPKVTSFLQHLMQTWRTVIQLSANGSYITTPEIKINRGIFQGDSLSPLWFCLALNPLSKTLNRTGIGYTLKDQQGTHTITHQLYMDDLKLYAPSHDKIKELIQLVKVFSDDISMRFGLDKCKIINIDKGKCLSGNVQLGSGGFIESMTEGDTYKYLGYEQAKGIEHTKIKETLTKEYLARVKRVCNTSLTSKNMFKALNTMAIPVLTYSFGVISWTDTDLDNIMRKTRIEMTLHRKHHPKSSMLRMTLPRDEGGRGLIDIKNLHNKQVILMRTYFHQRSETSPLHRSVCLADKGSTPLNLASGERQRNEEIRSREEKHREWRGKALHGRHPHDLDQPFVDKTASNAWLKRGELFPETEGFAVAIQDQVVNTKNYLKHIVKDPTVRDDRCRKCKEKSETIQHITAACSLLAQTDYLHRHNQVAAVIHQDICYRKGLITEKPKVPYYKYVPKPVIDTDKFTIYYDRSIITDRCVPFNKPDIIVRDKEKKEAIIADVAIPNTHNIVTTMAEKKRKYLELADEVKKIWDIDKVTIVPIVISSTGVIPNELHRSLETLGLHKGIYFLLQKAVIMNTTRIVRRFLSQE